MASGLKDILSSSTHAFPFPSFQLSLPFSLLLFAYNLVCLSCSLALLLLLQPFIFLCLAPSSHGKSLATVGLWSAVEARLLRFLSDARQNRSSTMRGNPYEDSTQLGRVMRKGWWPELLHWIIIITATKAVGYIQGLTVFINTKYSNFMGNVPEGQDRATSTLSRSLGVVIIG